MKKFKVKLFHEVVINAVDEEQALEKYNETIENEPQQDYCSFVNDHLKIKEIKPRRRNNNE
jgi:hypothetical protein